MANCTDAEEVFAGNSSTCTGYVDVFADNSPWLVGFLVCCSVQGSAGNLLILLAVAVDKTLRSSTDAFIANVAVMDLIISGVLFPTIVPSLVLRRNVYAAACQYMGFVFSSLLTCSLASLTVVAIDRYLFICRHALHIRLVGRRWSVGAMLASCWGVGFLIFMPALCGWGSTGYVPQTAMCGYQHEESLSHLVFLFVVAVMFPIGLTYSSYGLIARELRLSRRRVEAHGRVHQPRGAGGKKAAQGGGRKFGQIRTMFIISALFTLFWFPYGVICMMSYARHVPTRYVQAAAWLGDCNSCANSVVLGLVNRKYRAAYRRILCWPCKGWREPRDERQTQGANRTAINTIGE